MLYLCDLNKTIIKYETKRSTIYMQVKFQIMTIFTSLISFLVVIALMLQVVSMIKMVIYITGGHRKRK